MPENITLGEDTKYQPNSNINIDKLKEIPIAITKLHNPNSFPVWVLPSALQEIIQDCNQSLNFPIDFIAASILFTCGAANGLTTLVEVKKGWTETSSLFIALVGRAGTNKSHPLSFALEPIFKRDNLNFLEYEKELEEHINRDSSEKHKTPYWKKTIVQDTTIEALATIHSYNKKGVVVYAEELKGWLGNMNRYNSGSEIEFWLSSWSGKPIIIDRKSAKSINIKKSFIPVIGTIQNKILRSLTGGQKSENGFLDRILFVIPHTLKKSVITENEISDISINNYNTIISNILNQSLEFDENNIVKPLIIKYEEIAYNIFKEWQRKNTDRYNSQINEDMDGVYSKMEIYIHRIALTLQIMKDACDSIRSNKIEIESIKGSIEIIEYFIKQSIKVRKENVKEKIINSNKQKKAFYLDLPNEFTTQQAKEIGKDLHKLNDRYIERFLADSKVFEKIKRGYYRKILL